MSALALFCCTILLSGLRPLTAAAAVPRFEPGPCSFAAQEWAAEEDIDCGHLVVPENRRFPSDRTLRLAVAILRSTSDTPEPDPYLFIQGGPGLPTLLWAEGTVSHPQTRRIRERRDYVLLDLRGTGGAPDPCAATGLETLRIFGADLTVAEHQTRARDLLLGCARQAQEEGHDWTAFTSVQTAADIGDLMDVLPYEEWNLFGVSAGTRVALAAMRDVPARIRTVILDSPLPIAARDFVDAVPHFAAVLERMYAACAADAACREAFPELEADLYEAITRLEGAPLIVPMTDTGKYAGGTFAINAADMSYALYRALSSSTFLPVYPLLVQEMKAGNTTVMAAMVEALSGGTTNGIFNLATYNGMLCYDEATYANREAYERAAQPYSVSLWGVGYEMAHCDTWPVPSATLEEIEPVVSSIPTMILHGEFDHQTPPVFGEDLISRLQNGFMVVYPGLGHYPSSSDSCAQTMIADFLNDPSSRPDDACMEHRPKLTFATDVYVTGGIYRVLSGVLSPPRVLPLAGIGMVLLVQLSAVTVWPLTALRRRRRGPEEGGRPTRGSQWLAGVAALLGLGFVAGLGWTIAQTASTTPALLAFGVTGIARVLFLVPLIVGILSLIALGRAASQWRQETWSRPWRWHFTAVALASLGFTLLTIHWGLI